MTLPELRDLLLTVGVPTHHYSASGAAGNYIVWAEEGQAGSEHADDCMTDQIIQGTIDYFTLTEFDPVFNIIQKKLNSAEELTWRLNSIQYEDDTGYIHYEWLFEVVNEVG